MQTAIRIIFSFVTKTKSIRSFEKVKGEANASILGKESVWQDGGVGERPLASVLPAEPSVLIRAQ